jgi:hypothetical protein
MRCYYTSFNTRCNPNFFFLKKNPYNLYIDKHQMHLQRSTMGRELKNHILNCKITWWNCISNAYGRWYTYFVLGSTIRPFPPFTSKSCLHPPHHVSQVIIRNFPCPFHPCHCRPRWGYTIRGSQIDGKVFDHNLRKPTKVMLAISLHFGGSR